MRAKQDGSSDYDVVCLLDVLKMDRRIGNVLREDDASTASTAKISGAHLKLASLSLSLSVVTWTHDTHTYSKASVNSIDREVDGNVFRFSHFLRIRQNRNG